MKLGFTGAGGGHFTPLIAVAEAVRAQVFIEQLPDPEMYFFSDAPYDEAELASVRMKFVHIPAGKRRVYASASNFFDYFVTAFGCVVAFFKLFRIFPDIIFAKGGYASFPTLVAAKLLGIPVIIHESDAVAGRVTTWAGKHVAIRVALSQASASSFFPANKVALTGQPIRLKLIPKEKKTKGIPGDRPLLLVLGGSQGSTRVNDAILAILPEVLKQCDVVHQAGKEHFLGVRSVAEGLLKDHPFKDRYFCDGFIHLELYYERADIVITRGGSTTLFETALWHIPSIVIPIPETISRDQTKNAYAFASLGISKVIEEDNLTPESLLSTLRAVLDNKEEYLTMASAGEKVEHSRDAALTIAREMLSIALSHR